MSANTVAAGSTEDGIIQKVTRSAHRVRGLSDRSMAWLFIGPTILLLFAFNIFPLIWSIYLSFTNYRANRPGAEIVNVGLDNYRRLLNDESVWEYMNATGHFLCWSITLQILLGF